jgi:Family of unknown function (DUF6011)
MSRMPIEFWSPTPIPPPRDLAELREYVLARSEKRSPRWRFRLAPDLVTQIQPKLTQAFARFECSALQCEGANAELLTGSRKDIGRDHWKVSFDLRATGPEDWVFKPTRLGWRRACDLSVFQVLRERLVTVFRSSAFSDLKLATLLQPHCLCCGKALTDPVSMARMIGPECWGSGSVNLPFTLKVKHAEEQSAA